MFSPLFGNSNTFIFFPPFSLTGKVLAIMIREKTKTILCTRLTITVLVLQRFSLEKSIIIKPHRRQTFNWHTKCEKCTHWAYSWNIGCIGYKGINETSQKILNASLGNSTRCKYNAYFKKWHDLIGVNNNITIEHLL